MYPGPSLVQAGQGEVRLYAKPALSTLNAGNNRTGGGARCAWQHGCSASCMCSCSIINVPTLLSSSFCSTKQLACSKRVFFIGCINRLQGNWPRQAAWYTHKQAWHAKCSSFRGSTSSMAGSGNAAVE
jgi:hypothetical protein